MKGRDFLSVNAHQWQPLSSAQKRIWYLENRLGCEVNNNNGVLYLRGGVQPERLAAAIVEMWRQHDSLRLQFHEEQGVAMQRVDSVLPPSVPIHNLRGAPNAEQACQAWVKERVESRLSIDGGKLYSAEIAIIDDSTIAMFMGLHHIVADGWSIQPIINSIAAIYSSEEPAAPLYSYLDVVKEDSAYAQSDLYTRDQAYWLEQLKDLPESFLQEVTEDTAAHTASIIVPQQLAERIQIFCKANRVHLSLFYPYLMYLYLHITTGHNDLLLGMPFLNRYGTEQKAIAGMFSSYVPLRLQLSGEETVLESLRKSGRQLFEAYKHQRYSLEDMVRDMPVLREQHSLFHYTVNYYNQELVMGELEDLFYLEEQHSGHQAYALQFKIKDWKRFGVPERMLEFNYKKSLFSEGKIEAISRTLLHLADQITSLENLHINKLSLLSDQERDEIVYRWNDTRALYPSDKTLTQLISEMARHVPDRVALECEGQQLTYRQLEARVNRLSGRLSKSGINRGDIVALLTYHSFESVIGLLAVMRTGAAYLPIDPQLPDERIAYIIQDADVRLALTNGGLHKKTPVNLLVVELDNLFDEEADDSNITEDFSEPTSLAYVIYTSGSSGKPKGVAISHKSAVHYCWWAKKSYVRSEADVFALYSSLSFDLTVTSIFVPLLAGCKAVIYRQSEYGEFVLSRVLRERKANIIKLTPAHLEILSQFVYDSPAVDRFIVGGERFSNLLAEKARSAFGNVDLYNEYGPTEATVGCMIYLYQGSSDQSGSVPIGRPISNMRIYVLDKELRPVLTEHEGEMYIAGDGLAEGYINRPQLNEERFIRDPFVPGFRMYKTGDYARMDKTGNLIYIGRNDEQLNIRGYRIETGEIEKIVSSHPSVYQVCVTMKEDTTGHPLLCCYYTGSSDIEVSAMKELLARLLPSYMIPMHFLKVESIPITTNGKKDIRALPAPTQVTFELQAVKPKTKTEEALWMMWSEALGTDQFGIDDSFWKLGGDSFRASLFIATVYTKLHASLTTRMLYEHPTIRELAAYVEESFAKASLTSTVDYDRLQYPLMGFQQIMFAVSQFDQGMYTYIVPGAVAFEGRIDLNRMEAAWKAFVQRHEACRTGFQWLAGGVVQQHIYPNVELALSIPCFSTEDHERLKVFASQKFELDRPPLIRCCIVRGEERDTLYYLAHHLVFDQYSEYSLKQDLIALYSGSSLPTKGVNYRHYLEDQLRYQDSSSKGITEEFWLKQFEDAPAQLELPVDRRVDPKPVYAAQWAQYTLKEEISASLPTFASQQGTTPFMVLFAVYHLLLHKYSGQTDLVIATPSSGRYHPELNSIIGSFIEMLPIRSRPEPGLSFRAYLNTIIQTSLSCMEHGRYSFASLPDKLGLSRELGVHPLYRTVFALEQTEGQESIEPLLQAMEQLTLTAKSEITFRVIHDTKHIESLSLACEYNSERFHSDTINRMMKDYEGLIEQVLSLPDQLLGQMYLSSRDGSKQLADSVYQEVPVTVMPWHVLFESQAMKTPDVVAVSDDQLTMTYRDLNEAANRFAMRLRASGAGRGTPVALRMHRSVEWIVSTIGVMKAGSAFVPVDPSLPPERTSYLLEDCGATILVVSDSFTADGLGVKLETMRFDWDELETISDCANQTNINEPDDIAYYIYTSGTTGKPKGTMVAHRGFGNLFNALTSELKLGKFDQFLQFANISFDASVLELTLSLLSGASLNIISDSSIQDVLAFERFVVEHRITAAILPPPYLNLLSPERVPSLKKLIVGGSSSSIDMAKKWGSALQLYNCFGPTETTIMFTMWPVDPAYLEDQVLVPIGKPIPNFRVSIRSANNEIQPIGVPGELCVSGIGLARGYLNNPEVTAMKFVPDPERSDTIMYRTGDLAKWLPDGNIVFLGRIDDQVKVRGYRIELGEIEQQMLQMKEIKEAVVLVRSVPGEESKICAFAVAAKQISIESVRRDLARRLPHWMVPTHIVLLPKIPLNINGKPDRKQLLAHSFYEEATTSPPVQSELEHRLADIWKDLLDLRIEQIGRRTTFFELGGNSLSLLQLQKRLNEAFAVELAVTDLFANPTIQQLAEYLDETGCTKSYSPIELSIPIHAAVGGRTRSRNGVLKGKLNNSLHEASISEELFAQVLNAAFAYCLLELFGNQKFELIDLSAEGVRNLVISPEHALDFQTLFPHIQQQWHSSTASNLIRKLAAYKPAGQSKLLPMLANQIPITQLPSSGGLTLGLELDHDAIELTLQYDMSKLQAESMKTLLGRIGTIVRHVLFTVSEIKQ